MATTKKKKLLPKDFGELLQAGDLDALKAVFTTSSLDARGGYCKEVALAFSACPDELARWLVAEGADLSAPDMRGNTPLHARARSRRGSIAVLLELGADVHSDSAPVGTPLHAAADSHNSVNARLLVERGARVDAADKRGLTPLELALRGCSNIDLEEMVRLAEILLGAGAARTSRMQGFVEAIGKRFEFSRSAFNPDGVAAADLALQRLYALFDVAPVASRVLHDGKSPIVVAAGSWQTQHQLLWELLVPSNGHAATVQGEVIRISGRIRNELEGNGGVNWDADFRKMAEAFAQHVQRGNALAPAELAEAAAIVAELKHRSGDTMRLAQLAVAWVLSNPTPIPLEAPPYER